MHKFSIVAALSLAAGLISSRPVAAAPILTIDQSQIVSTTALGTPAGGSVAQGFVPTLDGLDAVELRLSPDFGLATAFSLNIRSGAYNGSILGTSLLTTVPAGFNFLHFDFASRVPLTPGNLYFIQFVSPGASIAGSQANPYAAGAMSVDGTVGNPGNDVYFVEGLHTVTTTPVPEPATLLLVLTGLAGAAARRRSPPSPIGR